MGWSKRQFVDHAFEELGLASYVFDLTPAELQSCVERLDAMMASWNARGIRVGYPLVSDPANSSLYVKTNIPDFANEAIFLNLAIKIAPSYGKVPSNETKKNAFEAYQAVLLFTQNVGQYTLPSTLPLGAGNRWPWAVYVYKEPPPIETNKDGILEF